MSNPIVEWRYFASNLAKYKPEGSTFFEDAKKEEQKSMYFARMRLAASVRNLKQSIKNSFKGATK